MLCQVRFMIHTTTKRTRAQRMRVKMLQFHDSSVLIVTFVFITCQVSLWSSNVYSKPTHSMKDDMPRRGKINTLEIQGGKRTILRKRLTWVEGDIECYEMFGTHLAVLENPAQVKELSQAIYDISVWNGSKSDYHDVLKKYEWGMERRYWVGLSDNWGNGSEYLWKIPEVEKVKQSLPFEEPKPPKLDSGWTATQPDHDNKIKEKKYKEAHIWEHCIGFWNPIYYRGDMHTLNDLPCLHKYYVICDNKPYSKR